MSYEGRTFEKIKDIAMSRDISVIGIDGLGGAGKSTVSESVCSYLENSGIHTILLHIDDFIHVRDVRYNPAYTEWQCYYDLQWRYDRFIKTIEKLKAVQGEEVEAELYDKENDCYFTERYSVKGKTAVIVEGIFLQRQELQGVFDYMIYIDVPENIRLDRVLKRDTYIGSEQEIKIKYENRYFPAERQYFEKYRPDISADCLL